MHSKHACNRRVAITYLSSDSFSEIQLIFSPATAAISHVEYVAPSLHMLWFLLLICYYRTYEPARETTEYSEGFRVSPIQAGKYLKQPRRSEEAAEQQTWCWKVSIVTLLLQVCIIIQSDLGLIGAL